MLKRTETEEENLAYQAKILGMDKVELLEEMVRFQQQRSETESLSLSLKLMTEGLFLFRALEKHAETEELFSVVSRYRKHLELELHAFRQNQRNSS